MNQKKEFTLIELLVDTVISSLRFFKRGDKLEVQNTPLFLSGKRAASEVSRPSRWSGLIESLKNTPLFLKRGEGLGEGKPGADVRLFSREKKFFPFPREPFHFDRIAGCDSHYRHSGGDSASGFAESKAKRANQQLCFQHPHCDTGGSALLQ